MGEIYWGAKAKGILRRWWWVPCEEATGGRLRGSSSTLRQRRQQAQPSPNESALPASQTACGAWFRLVPPFTAPPRAAPATSSPANANRRAEASAAAREQAPGRGQADAGGRGGIFGPRERMGWTRFFFFFFEKMAGLGGERTRSAHLDHSCDRNKIRPRRTVYLPHPISRLRRQIHESN